MNESQYDDVKVQKCKEEQNHSDLCRLTAAL